MPVAISVVPQPIAIKKKTYTSDIRYSSHDNVLLARVEIRHNGEIDSVVAQFRAVRTSKVRLVAVDISSSSGFFCVREIGRVTYYKF